MAVGSDGVFSVFSSEEVVSKLSIARRAGQTWQEAIHDVLAARPANLVSNVNDQQEVGNRHCSLGVSPTGKCFRVATCVPCVRACARFGSPGEISAKSL